MRNFVSAFVRPVAKLFARPTQPITTPMANNCTPLVVNSQTLCVRRGSTKSKVPLRVVRVVDASCTAFSAGRMVISGCFSDVCAELDRLSQQEAA